MRTRTTVVSSGKTQALARVLHCVPLGYTRMCTGAVPPEKLSKLLGKFHSLYGIACTPAERLQKKRAGRANTIFAVYSPPSEYLAVGARLPWALLATNGDGVESEKWVQLTKRPTYLGYELVRHNDTGDVRWTWRRTKSEMQQLFAELHQHLRSKDIAGVKALLARVANQPGFHGVRKQSQELCAYAVKNGYRKEGLPVLYYVSKQSHGIPHAIPEEWCM
jgi:hypothetical protein